MSTGAGTSIRARRLVLDPLAHGCGGLSLEEHDDPVRVVGASAKLAAVLMLRMSWLPHRRVGRVGLCYQKAPHAAAPILWTVQSLQPVRWPRAEDVGSCESPRCVLVEQPLARRRFRQQPHRASTHARVRPNAAATGRGRSATQPGHVQLEEANDGATTADA